jgi:CRISPR/Cas system-associated exonuclease Cas4 (RecB family)
MLTMLLQPDFQFSQASLQAFVDCPRRFQLRYLRDVAWPAVEAEPIEEHERRTQHGMAFHRMVQQHILGVSEAQLSSMAVDGDLARWWANYRVYHPAEVLGERYPELTVAATVAEHRLVAKYDLLVVQPGQHATIFDWKTSQKRTRSIMLRMRLQTRVYRYLLVRAGHHFNEGNPISPGKTEMVYWFSEYPESPERLSYSAAQYEDDAQYLGGIIEQIKGMGDEDFIMTDDERRCQYCLYRSYCERGVEAGFMEMMEEDPDPEDVNLLDFDFEQIAEIAF